jgi:hypothetical protein
MLPGLDGLAVCQALRAEGANIVTPLLMLTAKDTESDKVVRLESGADDYMTKPFGTRELVARVSALLRRQERLTGRSSEVPISSASAVQHKPAGPARAPLALFGSRRAFVTDHMNPGLQPVHRHTESPKDVRRPISEIDCPNCGYAGFVQVIKAMRRYTLSEDWLRCDRCGHIYTRPRHDY